MPSLLNGLSAFGAGVSQFAASAGLETQKADLARQQTMLADQLATNRELNVTQPFAKSQLEATEAGANTRNAATNQTSITTNALTNETSRSNNAATIAGENQRQQVQINAPTPTELLFRFLKINPDGSPVTGGAAPAPRTSGGTGQDYTNKPNPLLGGLPNPAESGSGAASSGGSPGTGAVLGTSDGSAAPAPSASGTAGAAADPMSNPLVRSKLGLPALGSPEATRMAIAADVRTDPDWKYKTAGQQATEVERRVGEASGLGRPRFTFTPATQADPDDPSKTISGVNRGNTKDGTIDFVRTDTNPNRAGTAGGLGNRAEVYFKRVTVAANEATAAAQNIMELPSGSDSGWFAGRGPTHGLLGAAKETLTNALTTQGVQDYNTMVPGIGRSLAAIETGGLAPSGTISSSMEGLILKAGDSEMTKMRKMAELRQIVEKGMEPNLVDPKIPDVQKAQVRDIITQIQTAIPFTHHDITVLQASKNPGMTMADVVKARGIKGGAQEPAPAALAAPDEGSGSPYAPSAGGATRAAPANLNIIRYDASGNRVSQ